MINLEELKINREIPIPIYYQIEDFLRKKIDLGELPENAKLPTEKELIDALMVSRITIRRAIDNLVRENYVIIQRSKGTFVKKKTFYEPISSELRSYTEEAIKEGYEPSIKILSFLKIKPSIEIKEKLNLLDNDQVYEFKRLRVLNGEPSGIDTNYIPVKLVPNFSKNDFTEFGKKQSLYNILEEKYNLLLNSAEEIISATNTNSKESKLLGVKNNSPINIRTRIVYIQNDVPIIYMNSIYKTGYKSILKRKQK